MKGEGLCEAIEKLLQKHFWAAAKRNYTVDSISGSAILQVIDPSFSELHITKLAKIKYAIINMRYTNWKYYFCLQRANTNIHSNPSYLVLEGIR